MAADQQELSGPDLSRGVALSAIPDGGMLAGHANGKPVLLARRGKEIFAIGAVCTHYGGPLGEGLIVGDTVRCPWHHACFSLRTGEAMCAPALNPVARWEVERSGDTVRVIREIEPADGATPASGRSGLETPPEAIVIIGAGAAGNAAAETLRREGYEGRVTMIGADESVPYDRPNLSKDYLAGNASEEWIPLRPAEFYQQHDIELMAGVEAIAIDARKNTVALSNGETRPFDRLLVATGAEPIRLSLTGGDLPHVHYLRTLADSRAIIARAATARRAVVMGASFIGLEVAASLRARGLEVHVVAPEPCPLEKVLGPQLGDFIRTLHESKGVVFHLERTAAAIDTQTVTLGSGEQLGADIVVIGVGVRPMVGLAESAGAAIDHGVVVDSYLQTTLPNVFAAGDIARFPDIYSGERIRVEHWVVAERQGQTAARNMLGRRERFAAVPFFWSKHYDSSILYVGHAERWDEIRVSGDVAAGDCTVAFRLGGKTLAVATVGRPEVSLQAEAALERGDSRGLEELVAS